VGLLSRSLCPSSLLVLSFLLVIPAKAGIQLLAFSCSAERSTRPAGEPVTFGIAQK